MIESSSDRSICLVDMIQNHRKERADLLDTVFFETVNVVPARTISLPEVTRSVAKNQFGTVEDAMSVNLSTA